MRRKGHSPTEAYNETVEEALESLFPLVSNKGMDWMFSNCSTTAQRGALDWSQIFYTKIKPVISDCYDHVKEGIEAEVVINANSDSNYRQKLENELGSINTQEIWQVGRLVRKLRN